MDPSHPLAQKTKIKATDLEGHMIIMHEQGSYFQKMIHDLLEANNISVTMPITFSNNEAIKRAVEGGTGIAPISKKVLWTQISADRRSSLV